MGKARRKRGLISIEAIRGTDMEELVKRYKLSGKRIRKAIKSGLAANGLPTDSREALRQGLAQLREKPDQAIEQIRRKTGLQIGGSSMGKAAADKGKAATGSAAKSKTAGGKGSQTDKAKAAASPAKGEADDDGLATRLKNLLLDSDYASGGEIDREAVAKASVEELQEIPGCGKASAEKILAWAQGK